jgi:ABC-type branched-subunit amino acid transport system ATPase component
VRSGRPRQVARFGAARSFQNLQLFGSMTVRENVLVGCHRHGHAGLLAAATGVLDRREERALAARAQHLLDVFGLADVADTRAVDLPFGRQRLVEVARAAAAASTLLLLDEPMAGLSGTERATLAAILRELVTNGRSVLLVEHDLDAVMSLCDEVAVMDQGRLIACASPSTVRADPGVIAAYIGTGAVAVP